MKKLLIYLLAVFCVIGFASCGKPGPAGKDAGITVSDYTVSKIDELKEAEEGSVEILFRHPFGLNIAEIIQDFANEFQREYPSVTIKLEGGNGYDALKDTNINGINSGTAPTMTVGYPDHFAEYLISKALISLDKYINDPEVGYTKEEMDDFLPGYIQENRQFDEKGSYVGLPFNKSTEVLYYNKDFFNEFGLEVPKTWDEMKTVSQRALEIIKDDSKVLDSEGKSKFSWLGEVKENREKFVPCFYDSGGNLFTTIIHQFGGEYTKPIFKSTGIVDVQRGSIKFRESEEAKAGLKYFQDLANPAEEQEGVSYFNMPDKIDFQYGSGAINKGICVMNIGSSGGGSHYLDALCEIDVAPLPYNDEEHKYVIQQGTNICIMSQASDLQRLAAWLFIKHMLKPENTAKFAINTGYMPVRKSAYELDDYKDFLANKKILNARIHKACAQYATGGWNYFVDPAWAGSSKVRKTCEVAIAQILVDKKDIDTALQDAIDGIGQK